MITTPDQIIFEELKKGSDHAFKEVYESNRMFFINFARKYELEMDEILDIYQETYISFFENIENGKLVELSSSISTYLISIGKYKIMNHLRSNQRKRLRETPMEVLGDVEGAITNFDLDNEELSSEEVLLKKFFNELGEKCKNIITWFYYNKRSIKEIMELGGYNSENVVKSQKSRCMKSLRALCNTPS